MPVAMADEVRAMKRRVEHERTEAHTRRRDIKLGPGGLSDVEFLVQLLQLQRGAALPDLRRTNTLAALAALERIGAIFPKDAAVLRAGYHFQTRLRNLLYLRAGQPTSILPEGDEDQRALARALGLTNAGELLDAFYGHREEIRRVFEARFEGRAA